MCVTGVSGNVRMCLSCWLNWHNAYSHTHPNFTHKHTHTHTPLSSSGVRRVDSILFGTVNGALGVIAGIDAEQYQWLLRVQCALTQVVRGIGGFKHEEWRRFQNEGKSEPATGFIDGDLVESYLELPRAKQHDVVQLLRSGAGGGSGDCDEGEEEDQKKQGSAAGSGRRAAAAYTVDSVARRIEALAQSIH